MDKNIIITMGCSHTEGVGCWEDVPLNYTIDSKKFNELEHEAILYNNKRYFQEYGWPALVTKKMGYDVLYNMGESGSSISGQTKKLIEKFHDKDFSEFENKILIWLLNFEPRFSIYLKGTITNIMYNAVDELEKEFYYSHIKLLEYDSISNDKIPVGEADSRLEHIHNIRTVKEFCKNRNITFVPLVIKDYGGWASYLSPDIKFHNTNFNIIRHHSSDLTSSVCGHLNKDGYKILSNKIFDILNKYTESVLFESKENIKNFPFTKPLNFEKKISMWKKNWIEDS